jgi:hypothetical protein
MGPDASSSSGGGNGGLSGVGSDGGVEGVGTLLRPGMSDTHLAPSQDGSVHLAFTDGASSALWYGRCASNCSKEESWGFVKLAPNDVATGYQSVNGLGEDSTGRLHMLANDFVYATCAENCQSPSSWTFSSLASLEPGGYTGTFGSMVVAPSGAVTFVASSGNVYTCASNCGAPASWTRVIRIAGTALHLRRDGSGGLHLLTQTGETAGGERVLSYARCTSSCQNASSWQVSARGFLAKTQSFSPSLAANASGRVFVAYQQGTLANAADPNNGKLVVATCAGAGCIDVDAWTSFSLPEFASDGEEGTWLDTAGDSAVLLSAAGADLALRVCEGACVTAGAWSVPEVVDTSKAIEAVVPTDLVTCDGVPPETSSYSARFPATALTSKGLVAMHRPSAVVKCPNNPNLKSSPPIGRLISSF